MTGHDQEHIISDMTVYWVTNAVAHGSNFVDINHDDRPGAWLAFLWWEQGIILRGIKLIHGS